jgi:hypothetical protein
MRVESIAKECEAFLSSISQQGLGLVECQPKLGHHCFRSRQGLGRATAAEDDEVVSIRDNMGTERLVASTQTPVL